MKKILIPILCILFLILEYFLLVPLGLFWSSYFFFGVLIILLIWCLSFKISSKNVKKNSANINTLVGSIMIYVIITIIMLICISPLFAAKSYKNILPVPKEKEFSKVVQPFDITKAPIVTKETAMQIADKSISQEGTIGSMSEINDITLQNVNGNLYWIAPLEYNGFFAWLNNRNSGTSYIMVNANTKECKLVDANIKYQPGAFLNQDLARKLFFTNMSYGYTDFTFEVDDHGHSYWTASVYKNTVGFNGSVVLGTALVNAETGEAKIYSVKDTPLWVDRIQPENFVVRNINLRGKYINGFSPFNNNNKIKATDGTGIVYNNGKCYYYTGITSVGKDQSTLGFYLIDTRTMETTFFRMSGATETAAISSAEGKVQNLGYKGSFPILMNVENTPTYFVPLQDKNDLTKLYAMVSVQDYTIIATGETVDACKEAYVQALFSQNKLTNSKGAQKKLTGIVKRIGSYIQQGNSFYTFQLDNSNLIFIAPISQSAELPMTKEGDTVTITYVDSAGTSASTSAFDNTLIHP